MNPPYFSVAEANTVISPQFEVTFLLLCRDQVWTRHSLHSSERNWSDELKGEFEIGALPGPKDNINTLSLLPGLFSPHPH